MRLVLLNGATEGIVTRKNFEGMLLQKRKLLRWRPVSCLGIDMQLLILDLDRYMPECAIVRLVNYGSQGVHVNEEDFTRTKRPKICHPTRAPSRDADLLWSRWSSKYGRRGEVTEERIAAVDK